MKVVIADTSPINYLILIGCIDVLRTLYTCIVIPTEVFHELTAEGTPQPVSSWIQDQRDWIDVRLAPQAAIIQTTANLEAGEEAAIRLALVERDCLLLIDEAAGRSVASSLGVPNVGTLGVLLEAAAQGLVDLRTALEKLKGTNFRISGTLIEKLLGNIGQRGVS